MTAGTNGAHCCLAPKRADSQSPTNEDLETIGTLRSDPSHEDLETIGTLRSDPSYDIWEKNILKRPTASRWPQVVIHYDQPHHAWLAADLLTCRYRRILGQ